MKCEKCGKNEATTYYKETQNGVTRELHLCGECAGALGLGAGIWSSTMGGGFGSFLGNPPFSEPPAERACPTCGLRESVLCHTGRVGCANCYQTFADILTPYLQKIHGATVHIGAAPQAQQSENPVNEMRGRLKAAIDAEDYEQAARLRDEIRRLEGGHNESV